MGRWSAYTYALSPSLISGTFNCQAQDLKLLGSFSRCTASYLQQKKEKEIENSIPHSSQFADKSNIKWCTSGLPTLRPPFQFIKFELPTIYLTSVALSSYAATLRHNTRSTSGWFWRASASFRPYTANVHSRRICSLFRFHYKPALRNVRWSNTLQSQT